MGRLDRLPLAAGRKWELVRTTKLQKQISDTKRSIQGLQRKLRKNRHEARTAQALKKAKSNLSSLSLLLNTAIASAARCAPASNQPEFLGRAGSLQPYRDKLTHREVVHLLDKVAFGGSPELISLGESKGLAALVDRLLNSTASKETLAQRDFWANGQRYFDDEKQVSFWYVQPLQFRMISEALLTENPFEARMAYLVWHQHFAINLGRVGLAFSEPEHEGLPAHLDLLRSEAIGNFRRLARGMVLDSAMNHWLNNQDNHAEAPNQNFARELLELFLLGTVDPHRKTPNYDESSVVAATAFVSGHYANYEGERRHIVFEPSLHDTGLYPLFAGIPGAEVNASFTADQFIDHVLFKHPGSSRFLAERLFAQLVYPEVEEAVTADLAASLIAARYELKQVLRRILLSEAMFSSAARNPCISNPADYLMRLARRLVKTRPKANSEGKEMGDYLIWVLLGGLQASGQSLGEPPSVFGWKSMCGINRDGKAHFGAGFVTEQNLLGRSNASVGLINWLFDSGVEVNTLLGNRFGSADQIVDRLADQIFDISVTPEVRARLVYYLTHQKRDDGSGIVDQVPFDFQDEWLARQKIQGLLALLSDLAEANVQ